MGDYTAMTVNVEAPWQLIPAIQEKIENYLGDCIREPDEEKHPRATTISWSGEEVRCGSADELATDLINLMAEGDEERDIPPVQFAFLLWEDPKYEWLGSLYIYVPAEHEPLQYSADCDADGSPVIRPDMLINAVEAATSLEEARQAIAELTGTRVRDAWSNYVAPQLPEQLTLDGR